MCVCVYVHHGLGGGGEEDSKTLMSCTHPLFFSPLLWSLAGPRCHGNAHIAAGWLESVFVCVCVYVQVRKTQKEREGERDRCRGRGEQARLGSSIHYPHNTPTSHNTSPTTSTPHLPPPKSYHRHRLGWAVERPLLCSIV